MKPLSRYSEPEALLIALGDLDTRFLTPAEMTEVLGVQMTKETSMPWTIDIRMTGGKFKRLVLDVVTNDWKEVPKQEMNQ